MQYEGLLYRALNPVWARQPLSGEGARRYGGRFNKIGRPALYTAVSVLTAIREANQAGSLQPTVLVCYRAKLERIFDTGDSAALAARGSSAAALADDGWRNQMRSGGLAPGQQLAETLIAEGFTGLMTRSYARGAGPADLNLVLWSWSTGLDLIDDEGRLS